MHLHRHAARFHASAVLAVLSLVATAAPRAAEPRQDGRAAVAEKIGIENFGAIAPTYYRGAQPEGRDYADLAALGVKTVINLTSDDAKPEEAGMVADAGMAYVEIPMTTRVPPTAAELEAFLNVVNDPARQPVFVHCVGGKHRTGIMTAVYRMTQNGWTADRAYDEMKKYKFGASMLHPEFKAFVYAYPATLAGAAAPSSPQKSSVR